MSILAAGAGLLARGVSAFFGGDTRIARQERREERRSGRQTRRDTRAMEKELEAQARTSQYTPPVTRGDVSDGGAVGPQDQRGKAGDFMELAKKYWWAILLVVLFFTPFGKKLMGPTRRAPRRRAKPKVVTRYRTRKAPTRRRK